MEVVELNSRFARQGVVRFETSPLGGPVAILGAGHNQATIALQGAQVLSWLASGREQLWLSPAARLGTGKAVRGGIPVCWPWFGPHPVDPDKPAHGFVRTRAWDVVEVSAPGTPPSITFSYLTEDPDLLIWPHEAEARLTVTLAAAGALVLALETDNCGLVPMHLTQALHTYFAVDDIAAARVEGLETCPYLDKLSDGARRVQDGAITIEREVDRIYLGDTSRIWLADTAAGARIAITSAGSRSAVVWNPWIEKTARLGDMGAPDAYRRMLCIETANAGDDVVRVQPGNRHVLQARYTLVARRA